ncbi:UPF0755 protein [Sulfurivirga caldicuralii]|uniref:Endolytic murein transglycosylase n=1 Tax=Sulfurivirga caldicuralii TaxID=364032 RepID=A0A1N6EN93_9GAMM|nr:endolytic transglycosylase MltG [Sulfurivirga caldicuralii]SIN84447.1 UPF0755 protein [Sulfurivirga caldicuralii]
MVIRRKVLLLGGAGLLVFTALALSVYLYNLYRHPLLPVAQGQVLAVAPTVHGTLKRLHDAGLRSPTLFRLYLSWQGLDRRIQPGEIRLDSQWTMAQLAQALVSGPRVQYRVTLIPGMRFREALQAIQHAEKVKVTLTDAKAIAALPERLGSDKPMEGQLLPETYFYTAGTSDFELVKRAYEALWRYLNAAWPRRDADLPLKTPYEALILASIVEKETGRADERTQIAGVFIRRLKKGMRLQSDPTTIYGLGEAFDGNLTRADLRRKTPYNTYRINGLPPTPIALASKASIDAVLHPAPGKALYFVAKGDGSHEFSNTLREHNRAVQRYQLKRSHR